MKVKDDKTPAACEAKAVGLATAEAVAKSGVVCKARAGANAVALAKAGAVCEAEALVLSAGDRAKLAKAKANAKTDEKRKLDASDG